VQRVTSTLYYDRLKSDLFFCAEGVTVGQTSTLYYDRLKGALPSTSKLIFKAGLNRWESIQLKDLGRAEGLNPADGSEWWSVDIQMPKA